MKELYREGCNVLIMDLRLHQDAQDWLKTLSKAAPNRIEFYKANVADWKEIEAVFDVYMKHFGGTPFLVCPGAGIYEPVRGSLNASVLD